MKFVLKASFATVIILQLYFFFLMILLSSTMHADVGHCAREFLISQMGVHTGYQGLDGYMLGEGKGSGRVVRVVLPDQTTNGLKYYRPDALQSAAEDHAGLESLRRLNLGFFQVVRSKVLNENQLMILDDIQGHTFDRVYEMARMQDPFLAISLKRQWNELLRRFTQRFKEATQTNSATLIAPFNEVGFPADLVAFSDTYKDEGCTHRPPCQ